MEDMPHKQYTDELYNTVKTQFVSEGLLRDLRCELQTRIINMMRGERESGESLSGANVNDESKVLGGVDDRGKPHGDMRIVITNQLIMEYLHWYGYKYTAQTLSMETGTENKPPLRESLEGMVGPTKCQQLPIVLEIVAKMVQRQRRRIKRGTHALNEEESCTSITNSEAQDIQFGKIRPVVSFEKPLNKNTEACVDKRFCDQRSQTPSRKKSKARKKNVRRCRETDTDTVASSNQKDTDTVSASGNYWNSSTKVFNGFSDGSESIIYARSLHNLVDEEISDNCSMDGNYGTTPTERSVGTRATYSDSNFDDQSGVYIVEESERQTDTKTTNSLNQIEDSVADNCIETYAQHAIEPSCSRQEEVGGNDGCYTEGLETKNTLEQFEPDYFDSSDYDGSYADEEDENLNSKEDDYEQIFDGEDDEYLDEEAYNKKVCFLQREFQMAMQRKADQRDDVDETDDDDSDCANGELQSDTDNNCPYKSVSNDEVDEEEEYEQVDDYEE